jgi:SET domain-containing protein
MRYLSNGVIKSNNIPAPSELPTRNQYKGMVEPASRLSGEIKGVGVIYF